MSKIIKTYLFGLPAAAYYYGINAHHNFNHKTQQSLQYNLWINNDLKASDFPNIVAMDVANDIQKIRHDISYDWLNNTLNYPKNLLSMILKYSLYTSNTYFFSKDYNKILKIIEKK